MKIATFFIYILSASSAYAEIYKCIENDHTSYQGTPCKQAGYEFIPAKDISIQQQETAVKKLNADLQALAEKKKLQKEADDKERLLNAEEDKAKAMRAQAEATARQTTAIENSNNRMNNQRYYYPYYPVVKPVVPKYPIQKPLAPTHPKVTPGVPNQPMAKPVPR